jgi:hypothetical protein
MSNKARVQELLRAFVSPNKIRVTNEGFKVNLPHIEGENLPLLTQIDDITESLLISRSGTGVVIIINLYPEDRET